MTTREQVEQRQRGDYEAYERDMFERFATDEKTRVSEQINGVMHNPFEYMYGPDGELYFQGEPLSDVFARGIERAELIVSEHPEFMIELLRRHIEAKQYQSQRRVGRQHNEDDPYVLLHASIMPDAVNDGIDLGAYDKKRQKIMIRVTEPIEGGVRTTSASLDGGNRLGVQSMVDVCEDARISDSATPEDILAMDFWIRRSQLRGEEPVDFFRKRYDLSLARQHGGKWYAGRQDSPIIGTLQLIERHPEHTDPYVKAVYQLKQQYGKHYEITEEYKTLNYDFVKLMERLGREPDYIGDATAAGSDARANGETVSDPDCPTGLNLVSQAQLSTEQALALQGIGLDRNGEYIDKCMKCPHCKRTDVEVTVRDGELHYTCVGTGGCGRTTLPDSLAHKVMKASRVTPEVSPESQKKEPSKLELIRRRYGERAIIKRELAIGGSYTVVVDRDTHEEYQRL